MTMEILHARGDILDRATEQSEAAVLWLRSGFNVRSVTWHRLKTEFASHLTPELRRSQAPWKSPTDILSQLDPSMRAFKWVYLFSNSSDSFGYRSLDELRAAVSRCLDRLSDEGVRRLAMMHLPIAPAGDRPNDGEDLAAAQAMVEALREWDAQNPGRIDEVLLADKTDDFSRVL